MTAGDIQQGIRPSSSHDDDKNKAVAETTIEPPVDVDPKEERAFVWRLDLCFLTVGFLGYMFKYIDQTNIVSLFPRTLSSRPMLT